MLKNHLDIRDAEKLTSAERELSSIAASEIEFDLPPYNLAYLKKLHRHLFQDIYDWAGEIRTVDISKNNTRFCNVDRIVAEAHRVFATLEQADWLEGLEKPDLIKSAARFYGDLNVIHPFRDGNGRAQRLLFEHLIINAGYRIEWEPVSAEEWLQANINAVTCHYVGLENIFQACIGDPIVD